MAGLSELAFDLHHASEDEIFQAFVDWVKDNKHVDLLSLIHI